MTSPARRRFSVPGESDADLARPPVPGWHPRVPVASQHFDDADTFVLGQKAATRSPHRSVESFAVTAAPYAQPEAVSDAKAAKVADTLG